MKWRVEIVAAAVDMGSSGEVVGIAIYPVNVWRAPFVSFWANSRRSLAMIDGCGKSGMGNGALPGRVISAPLKPADCAPMVSQTWAATIMQSVGLTESSSQT